MKAQQLHVGTMYNVWKIVANICQYFHISANICLFLNVKSKVWYVLESAHKMQQLYDIIGQ